MTSLTSVKLGLAASGLVIWGYGIRTSEPIMEWLGIAMLVSAVVLRFAGRRNTER